VSSEVATADPIDPAGATGGFWARAGRYLDLQRPDLLALAILFVVAFGLRFFSPIMPDLFAHPLQGAPVSNCVHSTPIDAQGTLGTLCGLAYPFQRGYAAQAGAPLQPPQGEIFDEIYFGVFAHNDLKGINYFDPEPPLSKEFIAAGEWLTGWYRATFLGYQGSYADLGFNTFGWRIAACLFGSLCPPMMYLLARRLRPDRFFATAAAVLVCVDGMFFIQSRIGMIDIFPIFLILVSYWAFLIHWRARTPTESIVTLLLTGVCVGLAVSAKWISLAAWGTMLLFLGMRWLRSHTDFRVGAGTGAWAWGKGEGPSLPGGISLSTYFPALVIAMGVIPVLIYVGSWFPFFERGQFHNLNDLIAYQKQIYDYHAHLTQGHPYGSKWYTWPLLIRPVAYYFENQGLGVDQWTGQALVAWMVNLGNPWIWWTSLPALLYTAWVAVRERSFAAALITVGFLSSWLPFARISRVLFLYHMFGGLVFMILALAFSLSRIAGSGGIEVQISERLRLRLSGRTIGYAHLVVGVLFFLWFYPIWTGLPMGDKALLNGFPSGKAWLQSWV
jgi:dolichyl-phosphate-mannose--protein O-mannosyl transferase